MTRAREFSQQLGTGNTIAASNVTFEAVRPFLTTSNVRELANLYYSNARVFSNIIVASINDLFDVDTKYANGNTNASIGSALVWNGNTWSAGNVSVSLSNFTTDNLPEGNTNLYYTNSRARTALTPANPTIIIDYALGTIRANVEAVAASGNTTDSISEGFVNLYYSNDRVRSNVIDLLNAQKLGDLFNVTANPGDTYPTGHPNAGNTVYVNQGMSLIYYAAANAWVATAASAVAVADFANLAEEANTVLTISNFTTDDLVQGNTNLYFTNQNFTNLAANLSIDIFEDVEANLTVSDAGYLLTWNGTCWIGVAPANISNLGISLSAQHANSANIANHANTAGRANSAIIADTANTALIAVNANNATNAYFAYGAAVADKANSAPSAGNANVALFAFGANVANVANIVASISNFSTDDLREGIANLYFTCVRVLANVEQMSLNVFADVNTTNVNVNAVLQWNGSAWVPNVIQTSDRAIFAENANVANIVLSLSNFTTSNLTEGTNFYYTNVRLRNDLPFEIYGQDVTLGNVITTGNLRVDGDIVTFNVAQANIEGERIYLAYNETSGSGAEGAGLVIGQNLTSMFYSETNGGGFLFSNTITIAGNVIPNQSGRFSLGSPSVRWRDLYLGSQSLYIGDTVLSESPGGGVSIQDAGGNIKPISSANIYVTESIEVNSNGFIGANVLQFSSNVWLGTRRNNNPNYFAGMRVLNDYDTGAGTARGDVEFYTNLANTANSTAVLKLLGHDRGIQFNTANGIAVNGTNFVDSGRNFVGNSYQGTNPVAVSKGGTNASTPLNARVNLFADTANGFVAVVSNGHVVTRTFTGGTGVSVAGGDGNDRAASYYDVVFSIGQNVSQTASVTFKNLTVTNNVLVYGNVVQYNSNNVVLGDNMLQLNLNINTDVPDGYLPPDSVGSNAVIANPDLGITWAYDDDGNLGNGEYKSGGIFRDATDDTIKFFYGYTPKINDSIFINTAHASFNLANIQASKFTGNVIGTVSTLSNFSTDDLREGNANLYFSEQRVLDLLSQNANVILNVVNSVNANLDTANVREVASNLYYTNARVAAYIDGFITTSNIAEGSNLYYTNARVNAFVQTLLTTSNVKESSSNLYYTNARVNAFVQPFLTTANVVEIGNNLYLTNTRVLDALIGSNVYLGNVIAQGGFYGNVLQIRGINVTDNALAGTVQANVVSTEAITANTANIAFATLSNTIVANSITSNLWFNLYTANVIESASNLYFTNARAVNALIAGNYIGIEANGRISANLIAGNNITIEANGRISATSSITINDLTTANVVEVASNLYYTNTRVNAFVQPFLTTANVIESSSNLYYTNARVLAHLAASNVTAGNLFVTGDLQVQGNAVYLNAATLVIEDKNIVIANAAPNPAAADGAGITIEGANANIQYSNSGDKISVNKNFEVTGNLTIGTGSGSNISGISVLTADTIVANVWTSIYTANVIESASNLYYTNTRVNAWVQPWLTTANVRESSGNLYYTNTRVNAFVQPFLTTGNVTETSGNLYFTNARVVGALIAGENITIEANGRISANTSNISSTITATITATSTNNTTNVSNANVAVLIFDTSTYRTAKFVYTGIQTSGGSEFAAGEMLLMHNTNSVFATQYGMLTSSNNDLVTFDTDINNGNVRVLARTSSNSTIVTVKLTGITYTSV